MAPINPATDTRSLTDAVLELIKPRSPAAVHVASRDHDSPHAPRAAAAEQPRPAARNADAMPRAPLTPRDTVVVTPTIPSFYDSLDSGPDAGTVVGITLGAVAGFLALLWLMYTCCSLGGYYSGSLTAESIVETETSVRRNRRLGGSDVSHHRHAHRHRSTSRTRAHRSSVGSMSEVRRSTRPRTSTLVVDEMTSTRRTPGGVVMEEVVTPRRSSLDHRVVREEQRRSVSRGGTRVVELGPDTSTVVSSSTTTATTGTGVVGYGAGPRARAEEIVVIEQEPVRGGRREGFARTAKGAIRVERSVERRRSSGGGYRDIDPNLYAGGRSPVIDVRRSRSRRRSGGYHG